MNPVATLFEYQDYDLKRLHAIEAMPEPRSRYIIAMTPRSGSSFLCDMMSKTRRFGEPGEAINEQFIPKILKAVPGRTPEEYLRNFFRVKKTPNGVAGMKASWFQFRNFQLEMKQQSYLKDFKYIYLTRRDIAAQAVSLYKATATQVFHTNVSHSENAINRLTALEYDFTAIDMWKSHILEQEEGWQKYFYENRIFPLHILYEDVEKDVMQVMKRIATYVEVDPNNVIAPDTPSVFKKVGDKRNREWARRYEEEAAFTGTEMGCPSRPSRLDAVGRVSAARRSLFTRTRK